VFERRDIIACNMVKFLDKMLDWIVVILPFAGSVYLTVRPPERWQFGLIAFGLTVSVLTYIQQDRSSKNHEQELLETTTRLEQTSQKLGQLSSLLDQYIASRSPEQEAKTLTAAVQQAMQQAQKSASPKVPAPPTGLTVSLQ